MVKVKKQLWSPPSRDIVQTNSRYCSQKNQKFTLFAYHLFQHWKARGIGDVTQNNLRFKVLDLQRFGIVSCRKNRSIYQFESRYAMAVLPIDDDTSFADILLLLSNIEIVELLSFGIEGQWANTENADF